MLTDTAIQSLLVFTIFYLFTLASIATQRAISPNQLLEFKKSMKQKILNRAEIRAKFEDGSLGWEETNERLKLVTKPWQSSIWKKRRIEVLGDSCEKCSSKEEPLVIQHKWHPPSFETLKELAKELFRAEYALKHPPILQSFTPFNECSVPPPEMVERDSCPKCASVAVKYRDSTADWRCNGITKHRSCGYIFQESIKRQWSRWSHAILIERAKARHDAEPRRALEAWEYEFYITYREQIGHEATRLSFADHDRYMAMRPEDICTMCKKCAFKEDLGYAKYGKAEGRLAEWFRERTQPES